MEEQVQDEDAQKWHGSVHAKINGATADEAWSLLKDFCSLHRWIPSLYTCYKLEGIENRPGCIRYCASSLNRADESETIGWSKERLLDFDSAARSYTYEIVETNKGFGSYKATMRVLLDDDQIVVAGGSQENGCVLRWSFEADPIKGWTMESFLSFLEKLAGVVAIRLEQDLGNKK